MKNRLQLNGDLCESYLAIAISSHIKDYKLSWSLNQHLAFNFSRIENLKIFKARKCEEGFPMFIYKDDFFEISYYLIRNYCGADVLFGNIGMVDYILLIHECPGKAFAEQIVAKLKRVPNILAAYFLDMDQVKDAASLLEEMELHLIPITSSKNKQKSQK